MKSKLLFILLLSSFMVNAQEVTHIDFDDYNANIVFNSWNTSSTFSKVANPVSDATNPSAFVGQFTAGDNNDIGIGVIDPTSVFTSPFNLESNSIFKMKVFSTDKNYSWIFNIARKVHTYFFRTLRSKSWVGCVL